MCISTHWQQSQGCGTQHVRRQYKEGCLREKVVVAEASEVRSERRLGLAGDSEAGLVGMQEGIWLPCLPAGRGMPSSLVVGRSPLALASPSESMPNCSSSSTSSTL